MGIDLPNFQHGGDPNLYSPVGFGNRHLYQAFYCKRQNQKNMTAPLDSHDNNIAKNMFSYITCLILVLKSGFCHQNLRLKMG